MERLYFAATEVLCNLCNQTACRRGLVQPSVLQRRAEAAITVEIWRRAAKMTFVCWPREAELTDEAQAGGSGWRAAGWQKWTLAGCFYSDV